MIHIKNLVDQYKSKTKSPLEVVDHYLAASKKTNKDLNTYVTICEDEARRAAEESKNMSLPLFGIPIAVKDNFCTEGIRTTASSKVLENFIPPYESTVTRKLKEAGAILLGKTNMDAWAHGSSTETSDFGTSKNPYDTSRVPGGSSGGSAVAVAAGVAPYAIGSETAGSIRLPSAWCGVVGVKPTYGRVSRYGVVAMGSSLDCPGPITHSVEDAALLLEVIAGKDPSDATTSEKPVPQYSHSLTEKRKFVIGVSSDYVKGVDTEVAAQYEKGLETLKKMGHIIREIKLFDPQFAISVYTIIQRAEVSSNLARYDGIRYGNDRTHFGIEAKRRMMFGAFTLSVGYYDAFYIKAQKVRTIIIEDFKRAFKEVDIIAAPTVPTTALKIGESANNPMFGEMMDVLVEASSIAGIPGINMPLGLINGLPAGIQFMAPWFEEERMLNVGYQFEQKTGSYNLKPKNYYGIE